MTLSIYLRAIVATWALLLPLPWCLPRLDLMFVWILALACYLVVILAPGIVDLMDFDHREDTRFPQPLRVRYEDCE